MNVQLARGTVRKFAGAESFPERAARVPGPSILDPYLAHLEAWLAAGRENAVALWRELRDLGYAGTPRQVHRWLSPRRTAPAPSGRPPSDRTWAAPVGAGAVGATPRLPSPKQLAWLLTRSPADLAAEERATVTRLQQDPKAAW